MQEVTAYKSVDGAIFEDEELAARHDQDCIGELFDALLLHATSATAGNVTRVDQHRMCLALLNGRKELQPIIKKLARYIDAE